MRDVKTGRFLPGSQLGKETQFKKGLTPWIQGKKHSEDSKRRMGETKKKNGFTGWNKGKKMSQEYCKKLGERMKGNVPWNKGKTGVYSKETIAKMREAKL